MYRQCHSEASLQLRCVTLVCIVAALATSEELLLSLGRKALNLMMARTARPGASRADVIGCPSTWATRSVRPSLRSLLRSPPRPHPSPFPLALAQARPSHLCPLIQAGSPGQRLPKVRCLSDPPARRRAGALSGARHRVPDRARLPTGRRLPFPLSHKQVMLRCPQRVGLEPNVLASRTLASTIKTQKCAG